MRIGLDTNILVRITTNDDLGQLEIATNFIRKHSGAEFYVSIQVMLELYWVLTSIYKFTKPQVISALSEIMEIDGFIYESKDEIEKALKVFSKRNIDFEDCVIGLLNEKDGCEYTVTLDKAAAKLTQFKKI